MTPAETQHKELMGLIMRGMVHVLTYAERNRFAELTGFFRGKGKPPKAAGIRATDQDFEDPERFRLLCEKAIRRPIHQTPVWEACRPKGSKSDTTKNRKAERYRLECEALHNDPEGCTTLALFEQATGMFPPTQTHDMSERRYKQKLSEYNSALSAFRRDLTQGHQQAMNDAGRQTMISGIAESIRNIYNSHK